ncbi:Up-regulated during septation domain-containing protein [Trichoderma novae-zelandiae]
MNHIATCMNGVEQSTMSKTLASAFSMLSSAPPAALPENERPSSRKTQQDGQAKYQLFPKGRQSPVPNNNNNYSNNNNSSVDPDTASPLALNSNKSTEKLGTIPALKVKLNQQSIVRRRKANNIPDLGPMTTVQEAAMDSPTIPGRPAWQERGKATYTPPKQTEIQRRPVGSQPPRLPSPMRLAPLVIPETEHLVFLHDIQQASPPPMLLRTDSAPLPGSGPNQYLTPISSSTSGASRPGSSGSTLANSATTLPTPISASTLDPKSATTKQWEASSRTPPSATRPDEGSSSSHRRLASDSQGAQDRARAKRRGEQHKKSNSHPINPHPSSGEKKRSKSAEQRAFEELPSGCRPLQAASQMSANDLAILRQQALGQAERFEVLQVWDVERLSKELRKLDERVEYLRRTYNSLRNGRRNFHSRICQYLRSPMRGSRLSADSMLRQEEALAELDASIDGWVIKLERAENRRTRVRQKLLEHIAAAAILNVGGETGSPLPSAAALPPSSPVQPASPMQARAVQDMATPPRSPDRQMPRSRPESASPPPLRVVAQVPSMILELPAEPAEAESKTGLTRTPTMKSSDGESIRIYAGDELFALLTDVEDEIIRMNNGTPESGGSPASSTAPELGAAAEPALDRNQTELLRVPIGQKQSRSNLRLSAQPDSPTLAAPPLMLKSTFYRPTTPGNQPPPSPPAPVPPLKDVPKEGEVFLTSAVFKPK